MSKNKSNNAMSSIMTKAVAHFDKIGIKEIIVPEWDNTIIYAKPFTMAEKKSVWAFVKGDDLEFMVRVFILKALDKDGEPLFDLGDRQVLLNKVDSVVIMRIANQLIESKSVETQEENL